MPDGAAHHPAAANSIDYALKRARFDMNCPTASASVLTSEVIRPPARALMANQGPERAQYTIGVTGCDQRQTLQVICAQGGDGCFVAREHRDGAPQRTHVFTRDHGSMHACSSATDFALLAGHRKTDSICRSDRGGGSPAARMTHGTPTHKGRSSRRQALAIHRGLSGRR
jgi:hypothetical protein